MKLKITIICTIAALCITACSKSKNLVDKRNTTDFEKYWFNGEAELSSFQLTTKPARVNYAKEKQLYVTEPFSTTKLVSRSTNRKMFLF
jgi:hypothetical protein